MAPWSGAILAPASKGALHAAQVAAQTAQAALQEPGPGGQQGGDLDGAARPAPGPAAGQGLQLAAGCTSQVLAAVAGSRPGHHTSATTPSPGQQQSGDNPILDEFQIVKAVVLGLVTCIILLSICKMVFQIFVRYAGKTDGR